MSWHHPRIRRMKLIAKTFAFELVANLLHPLRHDQQRPGGLFRQKVTHRSADGSGQPNDITLLLNDGELAVDLAHPLRVTGSNRGGGFLVAHVEYDVGGGVNEINEPFDGRDAVHSRYLCADSC